jgi:hypothetical protein
MTKLALFIAHALLIACGAPSPAPAPLAGSASAHLVLADMKLSSIEDNRLLELALAADGRITWGGQDVGTLEPDGEAHAVDGKLLATITADGTVVLPRWAEDRLVIRDNGTVVKQGVTMLEITSTGDVTGEMIEAAKASIKISGPPAGRRALVFAWIVAAAPRSQPQ